MKRTKKMLIMLMLSMSVVFVFVTCTHDDEILISKGPNIVRGNERVMLSDPATVFDKSHSNVGWETAYLGETALLTGRFNSFGFTSFNFVESNKDSIDFEAWVWVNSVNTGEPGRDQGCLQGTFGVDVSMTTQTANVAILKSKSVEYSTTDNGYVVRCDFTFHGVTKEVTAKLKYVGKTQLTSGGVTRDVLGFSCEFQFLAKSDFLIASNNIPDNMTVKCNAIFRRTI
jgi:polyisoprenoid-binding protein YceI